MKDFSLISNYNLKGIHIKDFPKMRNPGMKEFPIINMKENPSKNEKSRNEGFLFNFYLNFKRSSYKGKSLQK